MRALLLVGLATALALQAQPRVQAFTLPNGLRVLHLEDHERPLVRARLCVSFEPTDLPPGRQGLPLLTLRMYRHSDAADLKAEDLHRLLEDSGILWTQAATRDAFEWNLVARSRDQDRAMGLLADRLQRTVLEPAVMEVQRLAAWRQVDRPADSPHARLRQALEQGPESKPTFTSLSAITWEELLTFRARVFRPDRAVLVLHGDLGLEQAKRLVLLSLGAWASETPPRHLEAPAARPTLQPLFQSLPQPPTPPLTPPAPLVRISAPGTDLRVQALAPQPAGLKPETAALLSLLIPGHGTLFPIQVEAAAGCLVATLDVSPSLSAAAAWSLLPGRLEALGRQGFTQHELDQARAAWLKSRSLDSLHPAAQMDAALAEARGRGVTAERMATVTLETLNAGLGQWLDPAHLRSGASGEPEALKLLPKGP